MSREPFKPQPSEPSAADWDSSDDVFQPFAAWMDIELARLELAWRHLAAPASNRPSQLRADWTKPAPH